MNDWIDLDALWKILVLGLICGAGLPALFAIGLRAISLSGSGTAQPASAESDRIIGGNPLGIAAGVLCFAVVLAAIAWGIYLIVNSG
ncbi:hypothetical protein [Pseudofrankia asymbiotica]|uniref:Uncharacterized protein n=1 Tax=Pseudofrankia asymbiotica TaxID=1834516 RepID=A0A1V2I9M0_9ACTN|nr:hypothetical protein [Pseudofrankia asymbiotica]ONH29138.1 hypothetical protein BL253_17125 [Pseudofrankia asymbiotica]